MNVILGHCVRARGCIAVELRIPDRRDAMTQSEFGETGEEGREEGSVG